MGVKLLILSWWTPEYIIRREIENLSNQTTAALKALIPKNATLGIGANRKQHYVNIRTQRVAMAYTQAQLVEELATAIGHEKAIELGRKAMFLIGQNIGKQTRTRLGVGDTPKDLTRAAKVLYRILGINFRLEWLNRSSLTVIIDRCALAEQYSKLTCEILSATDEGVIKGLQPNVTMKFKEYMTSGCVNCRADIYFNKKETE